MINKDPGKKHFYFRMLKSGMRIAGCVGFMAGMSFGVFVMAFLVAEVVGIVEEF
jgi:hypothetical protein